MEETLLETCASAGATLAAIVDGLLISRHITIEAEVRALRRQLADASHTATQTRLALESLESEYAKVDLELLLADPRLYDEIRSIGQPHSVDVERLRRLDARFLNYADRTILAILAAWNQEIQVAKDWDGWQGIDNYETTWTDFRRERVPPTVTEPIWQSEFDRIRNQRPRPVGTSAVGSVADPPQPAWSTWWREERGRLRELRDQRFNEYHVAAAHERIVRSSLSRQASPPRGLWSGFVMVVILTVLCVVIPILYLTPSTERGPLNAPVIVLLFFLGIAVLLAYIVFEILSIRRVATDREDDSDGGSQDRGSA